MTIPLVPKEEMKVYMPLNLNQILKEKGILYISVKIGGSTSIISWIEKLNREGYPISNSLLEGKVLLQNVVDATSYVAGIPTIDAEKYNAIVEFIKNSLLNDITPLKRPSDYFDGLDRMKGESPEGYARKLDAWTIGLRAFLEKISTA